MPLSRQQRIDAMEHEIGNLAVQLEDLEKHQTEVANPEEQVKLEEQRQELLKRGKAVKAAILALKREQQEAAEAKKAKDAEIWEKQELPQAEKEIEERANDVLLAIKKLSLAWKRLYKTETKWREQWARRGRPGRPPKSRSKRSLKEFLRPAMEHSSFVARQMGGDVAKIKQMIDSGVAKR